MHIDTRSGKTESSSELPGRVPVPAEAALLGSPLSPVTPGVPTSSEYATSIPPPSSPLPPPSAYAPNELRLPVVESALPPTVWNFAYGSNMSPAVLTGRRKITPLRSVRCVLHGYQLCFNLAGVPLTEPGFGNVAPLAGACVHGIAHEMSSGDFIHLMRTEGGNNESRDGYIPTLLPLTAYDGTQMHGYTLIVRAASPAIARFQVLPSHRYMQLLRTGATHHEITPEYINYLKHLPSEPHGKWRRYSGVALLLFVLLFLSPVWLLLYMWLYASGQQKKIKPRLRNAIGSTLWVMYNYLGMCKSSASRARDETYKSPAYLAGQSQYDTVDTQRS